MRVTLGSAPDSWGVWFPNDAKQIPWYRFLDEVASAGFRWIELGPYGYLPTEREMLRRELKQRGLSVSATFVMWHFEDGYQQHAEEVEVTCDLLHDLGAQYLLLIDDVYTNLFTGERIRRAELNDAEWARLLETTARVADAATARGLNVVLHPHAETHLEWEWQIDRFLAECDPRIGLCVDVGHHAYRGGDPVAFVRRHRDRFRYLHLKSVDRERRRMVDREGLPFAKAVEAGMFVEPSRGVVDFRTLQEALEEIGFDGFGIVEQDMYPCPYHKPLPIAKRTYEYLQGLGMG